MTAKEAAQITHASKSNSRNPNVDQFDALVESAYSKIKQNAELKLSECEVYRCNGYSGALKLELIDKLIERLKSDGFTVETRGDRILSIFAKW